MEHRKHPRIEISSLIADISDGNGFFIGNIDNISRFGLSVSDLPAKIDSNAEILTAIINGEGENFKMFLKPMWESLDNNRKSVGMQIESCSWGWTEFVMQFEEEDEEMWGSSLH